MPREREEFFRESNTTEREKIFVLAFEGNITEEKYFSEFKNSNKPYYPYCLQHLLCAIVADVGHSAVYH